MSGQMADIVVIDDEEFALVEPEPGLLFEPRDHGLSPVMSHTANMRGVLARYRVDDGRLLLSDLQVGHVDQPPPIVGVEAATDEYAQVWTYLDLDIPIDWSGDLLAGADPILELYVHSGFSPVWHYERVLALDIEGGAVVGREDRSTEVAAYRRDREDGLHEDDDENAFERLLKSIRLRLPFLGDGDGDGDGDREVEDESGDSDGDRAEGEAEGETDPSGTDEIAPVLDDELDKALDKSLGDDEE